MQTPNNPKPMALNYRAKKSLKPLRMNFSAFANIPRHKKDAIFDLHNRYTADTAKSKVDLTIGVYKDNSGQSFVFPAVREAQQILTARRPAMDYLPILGSAGFIRAAVAFAYGAHDGFLRENRVAACQTLSGTGALRLAFDFLKLFAGDRAVYVSTPTYANHVPILTACGFAKIERYAYYDRGRRGLDFEGLMRDLAAAEPGSVVLLQACGHNPTATDPSQDQWSKMAALFKAKSLIAVFDMAYQGFVTGDPHADAFAVRLFAREGVPSFVCQSFAKNLGLYGQRTGALSVVTASEAEKTNVESQLETFARRSYSNPPRYGAEIAEVVLCDQGLRAQWLRELKALVDRMGEMRRRLRRGLEQKSPARDWGHLANQTGMFCYTGLAEAELKFLREGRHVYLMDDGRMSVPGLNENNVDYVVDAISEATSGGG